MPLHEPLCFCVPLWKDAACGLRNSGILYMNVWEKHHKQFVGQKSEWGCNCVLSMFALQKFMDTCFYTWRRDLCFYRSLASLLRVCICCWLLLDCSNVQFRCAWWSSGQMQIQLLTFFDCRKSPFVPTHLTTASSGFWKKTFRWLERKTKNIWCVRHQISIASCCSMNSRSKIHTKQQRVTGL